MKKTIYLFTCLSLIYSCKSQEIIIENKKKDLIVFKFKNNIPKFLEDFDNTKIYRDSVIIVQQRRMPYGSNYFDKYYTFVQEQDTMSIKCICVQGKDYYFKNMEFKSGKHELNYTFPKKYNKQLKKYEFQIKHITGNEIKTSKKVQNILFKNAEYDMLRDSEYKNLYFRDLKFIELDLKDTINVKLKRIK